jgi:hypothetical protein
LRWLLSAVFMLPYAPPWSAMTLSIAPPLKAFSRRIP